MLKHFGVEKELALVQRKEINEYFNVKTNRDTRYAIGKRTEGLYLRDDTGMQGETAPKRFRLDGTKGNQLE